MHYSLSYNGKIEMFSLFKRTSFLKDIQVEACYFNSENCVILLRLHINGVTSYVGFSFLSTEIRANGLKC